MSTTANIMNETIFAAAPKGSLIRLTTTGGMEALAVKRGDGSILEVKRDGTSKHQGYSSLDAWKESFDNINNLNITTRGPKYPRVSHCNPPTEDVKTVRRIHNPDGQTSMIVCHTVFHYPGEEALLSETERVYNDVSTSIHDKTFLKLMLNVLHNSKEKNKLNKSSKLFLPCRSVCHQYVMNYTTNMLEPIYYCIRNKLKSRFDKLVRKAYELPDEELIHFRYKFGTSFAELGVPLGPDGKPEFWKVNIINGQIGKMTV